MNVLETNQECSSTTSHTVLADWALEIHSNICGWLVEENAKFTHKL